MNEIEEIEVVRKHNDNAAKWHFYNDKPDVTQMWLADMDFAIMPSLKEKLTEIITNGELGYSFIQDDYYQAVSGWITPYCDKKIESHQIIPVAGSITAMCAIIKAFSCECDYIAYMEPAYHAFKKVVDDTNRRRLIIPLIENENGYDVDLGIFEEKIKKYNPSIFILNNPHNPTGEIWNEYILETIIKLSHKYGFHIISDEVHMDFNFGNRFISMCKYLDTNDNISVLTAPTKSFNIAGLKIANVITDKTKGCNVLKRSFAENGMKTPNLLGIAACTECYTNGKEWIENVNERIYSNYLYAREQLQGYEDIIKIYKGQGTYFLWMKGSNDLEDITNQFLIKGRVRLERGGEFGDNYYNYARLTLGCSTQNLREGIEKIKKVLKEIKKC